MNVGDEVVRKNLQGGTGVIVAAYRNGMVRVRWQDALRPFRGGSSDNHSVIKPSSLLPATEENLDKQKARRMKRNARRLAEIAHWRYCDETGERVREDDYYCFRCDKTHTPEEVHAARQKEVSP